MRALMAFERAVKVYKKMSPCHQQPVIILGKFQDDAKNNAVEKITSPCLLAVNAQFQKNVM